ncbi:hypothetical protein OOZ15_04275 [Galbibacter sp. EGI 63066]|uniref:DUF2683 family protein n=1 Tax=Galbibacter sp. EGI 63066 TaxID=2993559 RepID=UPI002248E2ED|nr:DUF2683 family protein [Galbibacter sp. EGI 63066]MCX2679149.1 hypothetical protein [Galbibacter sp. EGI 63066]
MATITIKINERTKAGKAFKAILEYFINERKGVEVVGKSPYDPKFVAKIRQSEKEIADGKTTVIDTDDIWGSLGLK